MWYIPITPMTPAPLSATLPMKHAKLFENGRSQAVRLPKEFRFTGTEVLIHREGNAVILLPADAPWARFENLLAQYGPSDILEPTDPPMEDTAPLFP